MAPCFHVLPAPSPPSFTPPLFHKLLSLHFPIVLHLSTFSTFLFTPSLSPHCVPTPASLSSFLLCCSFYGYPLATTHYLIPTPSLWIAHPIPQPLPVPLTPHFRFFIILWTRSITMVQLYPIGVDDRRSGWYALSTPTQNSGGR